MSDLHTPVLLDESISGLLSAENKEKRVFVDATLWLGGHSRKLLAQLRKDDILLWFDRDSTNLEKAVGVLGTPENFVPVHASFAHLHTILESRGIPAIDGILYDLWVSSVHYDEAERWFSLRADGPLDMRFDQTDSESQTAEEIVAKYSEPDLIRIFRDYADEPKAYFIAKAILEARKNSPITSTFALKSIIESASFDKKSTLRVFQALRIEANDEFGHIRNSLGQAIESLRPGWVLCVITFHSIEDRIVKQFCKPYETPEVDDLTGMPKTPAALKKVTKKPIEPSASEIESNPRSRSAKLRIYKKI